MGGDEGKDFQRDAVYGYERVLPLADGRQRRRCIPVKLRNLVEGETTEQSQCTARPGDDLSQRTMGMDYVLQFLVESEDELRERQALPGVNSRVHGEDEERKEVGSAILRARFARRDARSISPSARLTCLSK